MTTAAQILTRAAQSIKYLGRGETLTAQDATDALNAFNAMLDSWSLEALMSYVQVQRSFALVTGQQSYTIGTSGTPDISATRPIDIISAFIRDSNSLDYPIRIINQDQWDAIGDKGNTSQIPTMLYYDSTFPLATINIYPIPLLPYTVFYNCTLDQVDFTTLTQSLSMPVGYERCMVLNLALELLSANFPNGLTQPELQILIENAQQAKGNIKRANIKEVVAEYDSSIVSRADATYNIYTDDRS